MQYYILYFNTFQYAHPLFCACTSLLLRNFLHRDTEHVMKHAIYNNLVKVDLHALHTVVPEEAPTKAIINMMGKTCVADGNIEGSD